MAEGITNARQRVHDAISKMLPRGAGTMKKHEEHIDTIVEALEDLAFEKLLMEFNKRNPRVTEAMRRFGLFA